MSKLGYVAVVGQLLLVMVSSAPTEPLIINVNTRRASHMVDPHFISLTISPTELLQGRPFGMGNNLTLTMLKELSPGYIRLGGPDTNRYAFRSKNTENDLPQRAEEIIITEEHWKRTNDFLRRSGMEVIACVSSGRRGGQHNKWDSRNALDLATFSDRMHYNITWQLGYEPIKDDNITGTQLGKDLSQLRGILNAFPRYQQAKIIGPDVKVLHRKEEVEKVLDLLIEAGPAVNAVTWHPRWPHASAITPSDSSAEGYDFPPDYLEWDRNQLHKLLQRTLLKKPFWIGEPKTEHTGSFAEGLIYARRLVNAAKLGIEVVMKEPLLKDIAHPKAEYWVAMMHKKMLGRTILDTWSLANHSDVTLAVHCTSRSYPGQDGGVSVLAVNTHHSEQRAVLRGFLPALLGEQVHQYALTAGKEPQSIFSQMTYLNGEPLLMAENGKMPEILPKKKHFGQNLVVKLPPYSIGFWVVPQAQVPACQVEPFTFPTLSLEDVTNTEMLKSTQKGINDIRNMNEFLVSKLLHPLQSDEQGDDVSDLEAKRSSRQTDSFTSLAQELRDRMGLVKKLISMNMNALSRSTHRTDSEEVDFRKSANKIDKLADDLQKVINGDNQEEEFSKFLEMSGLKKNFGKIMMEERQARGEKSQKIEGEEEKRRRKRDVALNILKKYPLVAESGKELEHLEKYYKKLLDKYTKTSKMSDKKTSFNLKKFNRDLQEDLLLKEITVLEKTEETLTDMMKNHLERFEAIEEMMKDELEQMKDEKIAMLLDIKSKSDSAGRDEPAPHPNQFEFLENFLKEQEKIMKKRETITENDSSEEADVKVDPLEHFKTFLKKRREEFEKRGSMHEKLLEFRNKFKTELEKAKETLPLKTLTIPKDLEKTTTVKPAEAELSSSEKRRENVLKYMADYIDDVKEGKESPPGFAKGSNSGRAVRKTEDEKVAERAKKSVASAIIDKVFESIFEGQGREDKEAQEGLVGAKHLPEYLEQEVVPDDGQVSPQGLIDEESEDIQKFRGLPSDQETYLPAEPILEALPVQSATATEPFGDKSVLSATATKPSEGIPVPVPAPGTPDSGDVAHEELAAATETETQYALGDGEAAGPRSKRETHATKTSAAPKNDLLSDAHREKLARNSIVKKFQNTTPKAGLLGASNIAKMADETLKLVLDHVIPEAYGQAKKEIENLAIPDYISNLGKIVDNLEHIDTILKNVAKSARPTSTGLDHIQKVKRSRRDADVAENKTEKLEELMLPTSTSQDEIVKDSLQSRTQTPAKILAIETEDLSRATTIAESSTEQYSTTTPTSLPTSTNMEVLIDELKKDPIVQEVLNNVAEGIVEKEISERLEKEEIQTEAPPVARKMDNARMKIIKKTRKFDSGEEVTSPMLNSERNIMALIVDNMLKHHGELSRQGLKREVAGFFRPLNGGYARRTRQSVLPMQTPNDERVSQFLQQLQPGVYVVPSKDMQNVHAEQTSRTESGRNGKVKPNVVTLNIYYDKKSEDGQGTVPNQPSQGAPSPIPKFPAANWFTAQRSQLPTLAKPVQPFTKFAPAAQPTQYLNPASLIPKYYPPLQPVQQSQPAYTGVYAEPKTFKTNAPQLVPSPTFTATGWRKPENAYTAQVAAAPAQAYQHPAYASYWQSASKAVEQAPSLPAPQQPSYADSWPADSQTMENQPPSNELNEWHVQKSAEKPTPQPKAKQVIEPYWNKTLKEIFQETSKDPFWKFLEAPYDEQTGSAELSGNDYERHENSRKKRSLENVESIQVRAYNVRPFFAWAAALPESSVNAYAQDNTLGYGSEFQRDKRSMLDNLVVKESSNRRYPLENDLVLHKVLARPSVKPSVDGSLQKLQLISSQPPGVSITANTKPVNNYQVDSNPYVVGSSVKRAVPVLTEDIYPSNANWQSSPVGDAPLSQAQLRSLQNQYLQNDREISFPEATVTSMSDSFPFPLKQMYEMFVEFIRKMIVSTV